MKKNIGAAAFLLGEICRIIEAHQEGARLDAGFDGGEFSGPDHAERSELEQSAAVRQSPFDSLDEAAEILAAEIGWRRLCHRWPNAAYLTNAGRAFMEQEMQNHFNHIIKHA